MQRNTVFDEWFTEPLTIGSHPVVLYGRCFTSQHPLRKVLRVPVCMYKSIWFHTFIILWSRKFPFFASKFVAIWTVQMQIQKCCNNAVSLVGRCCWLSLCGVMTVVNVLTWLFKMLSPQSRTRFIRKYLKLSGTSLYQKGESSRVKRFVVSNLGVIDHFCFLLYMKCFICG